ncbi:MAG: sulfatase [Phycisphaerae bacterium]
MSKSRLVGALIVVWLLMTVMQVQGQSLPAAMVRVALGVQSLTADRPPNIMVILADDLGYGDLSSYGARDLRTPNIDRLVNGGIRFDNFYANCPLCSPTRAALLTGRYPDLVGVPGVIRREDESDWGSLGYLSPRAVTLPQLLKSAGYQTALFGKWHLGYEPPNTPNARGFDLFQGWLGGMMDDFYKHRRKGVNDMRHDERSIDPEGHATELFTRWAIDYLKRPPREPFFLCLAHVAPHKPIQPPREWLQRVKERDPRLSEKRARLVALIEHLDEGIGQVMKALHDTGLAENTLVVFASDNGGELDAGADNGSLRAGKWALYEGGIKVPLCAVWPGRIGPGSRSHEIMLMMDLFPTLLDAAGVSIDHAIDGRSFLPVWLNRGPAPARQDVLFVRREGGPRHGAQAIYAVRRGDWKLLQSAPFSPLELYNLQQDPREEHDLAAANRPIVQELSAVMRRHILQSGQVPWQKPSR